MKMKMKIEVKIPRISNTHENTLQLLQGQTTSDGQIWGKGGEVG